MYWCMIKLYTQNNLICRQRICRTKALLSNCKARSNGRLGKRRTYEHWHVDKILDILFGQTKTAIISNLFFMILKVHFKNLIRWFFRIVEEPPKNICWFRTGVAIFFSNRRTNFAIAVLVILWILKEKVKLFSKLVRNYVPLQTSVQEMHKVSFRWFALYS